MLVNNIGIIDELLECDLSWYKRTLNNDKNNR